MLNKGQPEPRPGSKPAARKGTLVALIGAVAAAGLYTSIPADESGRKVAVSVTPAGQVVSNPISGPEHLKAYRDIVGVWTVCDGDTKNVTAGTIETREGCQARLERQLLAHAEPVMACVPTLAEHGRDYQRWAAVSLAYNIGTSGFCGSTVARRFNARQWRSGCDAFRMWNKAGGKVVQGLVNRRERERSICLTGLAA
ncbi:lysozyme [Sphingomonas sp. 3-13AW]|uniref:lysozyme n=1 Tax=Sphingomonas sp. 3-13AW TaxID=3050450 RepID=UPI003BB5F9C0